MILILTAIFHLVAFSRRGHLWAGSDIVVLLFFADLKVLALHGNPLDLASSSSLGHAANLAHWAHEWLVTVSLVVLHEAESEVFALAFPAVVHWRQSTNWPEGSLRYRFVVIGGNRFWEVASALFVGFVVDSLSGSKSKGDPKKFHFFVGCSVVFLMPFRNFNRILCREKRGWRHQL